MFTNAELMTEHEALRKFALKLTKNPSDADDLLQSTIVRIIEKKHLFQEGTNLLQWASKVMFNLFASNYRRKTKFETQYDPEPYLEKQSIEPEHDVQFDLYMVDEAMKRLSNDHRKILLMVCVKGMSYEQVADKLDIPVGTVRSRLSRARENLKGQMKSVSFIPHKKEDMHYPYQAAQAMKSGHTANHLAA